MGLMKTAAVKGIIPAGNKVSELRGNILSLITTMSTVLDERFGEEGLNAVAEIFKRLGEADAKAMTERLGLGSTLKDAVDAWTIIGHIFGAKMEPKWISENKVETYHPFCPQYNSFKEKGKLYCEVACLPYVRAIGENIGSGVKMEIVRPANMDDTCVKALVLETTENE